MPQARKQFNKSLAMTLIILISVLSVASIVLGIVNKGVVRTEKILINEVMAGNKSAVVDDTGNYSDWIELYNPGTSAVSLSGWGLSDEKSRPVKWAFPDITMQPGSYLLIYCDKLDHRDVNKPLHANFSLSGNGEDVVLTDNLGTVVDYTSFQTMGSDISMGRDPSNIESWKSFDAVTPGYPNTQAGHATYLASLKAGTSDLHITEVMSSNATTLVDDFGLASDWVEIYNGGKANVNLQGYGLSDKANKLMKWVFPNVTIAPGAYVVIYCSGKGQAKDPNDLTHLHTNFSISNYQESIVLSSNRGQVLDTVNVPQLETDSSYALDLNTKSWRTTAKPTPGYPNTDAGYQQWNNSKAQKSGLMISEAMTYNDRYAPVGSSYYDWVEIFNGSADAVNLKGYGLTDDTGKPLKWKFPDVTIIAGQYLVVYCSGLNFTSGSTLQTNFRLSGTGETVALYNPSGQNIDAMGVADVPSDMSFGRIAGNKGFFYFQTPTPGSANSDGAYGFAQEPLIQLAAGSYRGAQSVSISTSEQGAQIRYTTDGSIPTQSSNLYSGPITINKTTALRARAFQANMLGSSVATSTYLIDAPHNLPIVSLVSDPDNLFGKQNGIYTVGMGTDDSAIHGANATYPGANFWKEWERDVHFEYIQEDGKLGVSLDGGIRIFGAFSRKMDQKGLAIFARSRYGTDTIEYPFFTTRPYTQYKAIVLRASGQDAQMTKFRDIMLTSLVRDTTTLEVAAYRQSVLYINGQYWGIYNIREKINKYMLAQHNNIADPDSIDLLVANGSALVGDNDDYKDLITYVKTHDLSVASSYNYVASKVDIQNYMDWIITEAWTNNADLGNIKFWRQKSADGKWRWIFYDLDWACFNPGLDGIARMFNPNGMGAHGIDNTLLLGLIKNPGFKQQFLERCAFHFKNTFATERVLAKIDECKKVIEDEVGRDRERWQDGTVAGWQGQIDKVISFVKVRTDYMVYFVRSYFGLSEQQTIQLFGSAGKQPPATN